MQLLKRLRLTPRHTAKRSENTCPQKDLCREFYNSFIQIVFTWSNTHVHQRKINQSWHSHTARNYLAQQRKEGMLHTTGMNF